MNPHSALHMQMQLEGLTVGADGLLTLLPGAVEDCPLALIAQLMTGETVLYMGHDLPQTMRAAVEEWHKAAASAERSTLLNILVPQGLAVTQGHSKTYYVPAAALPARTPAVACYARDDARIEAFGFSSFADRVYAVSVDGQVVSACVSVRENDHCAEAWVATTPAYQQRGHARLVVCAWARAIVEQGKVPFYSHRIGNTASAALAQRIGCAPLFEEFTIVQRADPDRGTGAATASETQAARSTG
jgi:RimJ/RimL family protein N-acetyltransferase